MVRHQTDAARRSDAMHLANEALVAAIVRARPRVRNRKPVRLLERVFFNQNSLKISLLLLFFLDPNRRWIAHSTIAIDRDKEVNPVAPRGWTRRPLKSRNLAWPVRMAAALSGYGVRPNHISLASVAAAASAGVCLLGGHYLAAAFFIQLRLLCNLLDGMVAIEGGRRSPSGEIYNDLPDRLSDAMILLAAGYSLSWPHAVELGWAASLLGVLTAYVRVLGGACGLAQDFRGPMAKPQRMAVLTAACLLASFDSRAIAAALMVIVAGSIVTVVVRVRSILGQLEYKSS